jgi:adenylylsulfate reductase subunit B
MPAFVRTDKCDGCKDREEAACVYICPHDLMTLDRDGTETGLPMKAWNREADQCWECYACIKLCPQIAIECRPYADFVPMGGSVQPLTSDGSIIWTIKFRNGDVKRFKFLTRTTAEGSADPYGGEPKADLSDIADHASLFTKATHDCDLSQFQAG